MASGPVRKRRRLSLDTLPQQGNISTSNDQAAAVGLGSAHDFARGALHWNLEQEYEQRPRKKKREEKETTRLPIKTAEGLQPSLLRDVSDVSEGSLSGSEDGNRKDREGATDGEIAELPEVPLRQQITDGKEELARIAGLLNEDPEEHAGLFRVLSLFASSKHTILKGLALGTQLAVYKDVIPGYRIRPVLDEHLESRVSKEVRRQRNYEQALVGGYQHYVRDLTRLSRARSSVSSEADRSLASVAISCACALLLAVPHFNFREELLQIIVGTLSSRDISVDFIRCRETLEELFGTDEDGKPSLDAVALLTKMMKARHYHVDESVLNTLLQLRLLSELSFQASHENVDKPHSRYSMRVKKLKEKKEFRTKRQRKVVRENKTVEKEMREADATVSHEERDKMQAETLKLVFVAYFRILKARPPGLMGAVLEGLAKYAHLINQDFFGDLLEVLRDLVQRQAETDEAQEAVQNKESHTNRNVTRETLLCILTAFTLLQGQETRSAVRTLNLDLKFFVTNLYLALHSLSLYPNIEYSSKSFRLPDSNPSASPFSTRDRQVNIQTTIVLLLRCLSSVLLPPAGIQSIPPVRVAAFAKQLMTTSLHLPEKSCLATLGLMTRVTKTHGKKIASLWRTEEKRGDGVFDAWTREPEGSNPFASTVWEGELLRYHFCPKVREAVRSMEANVAQV